MNNIDRPAIDERLREFLLAQLVFFVATAPSDLHGHVNVSPKGLTGSFAVLSPQRVAYLDYNGSGAETIAHLRDNGRIVLMFCAFNGPPKIVRLHGRGQVYFPADSEFALLLEAFSPPRSGLRSIIEVDVSRIGDSCGYGVPQLSLNSERDLLPRYWERKSPAERLALQKKHNSLSIDGLPAVPTGRSTVHPGAV